MLDIEIAKAEFYIINNTVWKFGNCSHETENSGKQVSIFRQQSDNWL